MSDLILKVLSGPNEGARARLHPNEEVTVGRGLDCDVIFSDQGLAPTHIRLTSDGQSVRLLPVEGAALYVADDLREATPESGAVNCALFSPIKIAGTILIVAQGEEASWPLVDLEIFSAPKREPMVDEAREEGQEGDAAPLAQDDQADAVSEAGDPASEAQKETDEESAPEQGRSGKKILFWSVSAGALVVLGLVFLFVTRDRTPEVVVTPDEKVADLLQQVGLDKSVTFEFDRNGVLALTGFVKTSADMLDLRYLFSDQGYAPRMNIAVLNLQANSVKTLLSRMDVNWHVQGNVDSGEIELQGYVPNEVLQNQIVAVLQRDLPQLRPLDLQLITADAIKTELEAKINALKLSLPLQTVLHHENNIPRRMVVSGEVEPAEKTRLMEAMQTFKQTLFSADPWGATIESQLDIQSQVTDKVAKAVAPPPLVVVEKRVQPVVAKTVPSPRRFGFSGMIYGDVAVAIGSNGKTYSVGDTLPNGYVITRISDKGVGTQRGSKNKFYQIGKE
ncbi:type III secretion system inner membrane ring subunit SctD [Terasakiella pusilla]|uniref:type III secretion system inner membrane ring subunit SctD n=1 Tax=Terasakiella pusilla TaxID=64973 RepID=UPI003AA8380C